MKRISIMLLIAAMLFGVVACKPELSVPELTEGEAAAVSNYINAFGHVRVLGDIDHVLKGEKVDDEPGVTVQSMVAGEVRFNENKTELVIPLTLTKYDFDGHRNPEDSDPEKYTRIATGAVTITLKGAMNAEGTGFVAKGYTLTGVDLTLDVDDSTYIWLELPEVKIEAEKLEGIFTTKGGVQRANLTVTVTDGKPAGIADLETPKFGDISGEVLINGINSDISEF